MKLTMKQLLTEWRQNLNESTWMMNDGMGGPQDQAFPEGTSIDAAADQMVVDMDIDFPRAASEAASILRSPDDLRGNLYTLGLSEETAEALDDALESLDVEGSGNFDHRACCEALFNAINARAGSHLEEGRKPLYEHVTDEEHEHPHGDESDEDHCDESLEEMIRRVAKEVMAEAWSVERGFYAKEEDLPIYHEELAKLEAQGVTNHNALLDRMVKAIERRGLKWDVHTFEAASGKQA